MKTENKAQHTPGPWKYLDGGIISNEIQSYGGFVVLEMPRHDEMTKEDEANARLIAAAPELLEALKEIQKKLVNYDFMQSSNNNQGRVRSVLTLTAQAIAKAEGK